MNTRQPKCQHHPGLMSSIYAFVCEQSIGGKKTPVVDKLAARHMLLCHHNLHMYSKKVSGQFQTLGHPKQRQNTATHIREHAPVMHSQACWCTDVSTLSKASPSCTARAHANPSPVLPCLKPLYCNQPVALTNISCAVIIAAQGQSCATCT